MRAGEGDVSDEVDTERPDAAKDAAADPGTPATDGSGTVEPVAADSGTAGDGATPTPESPAETAAETPAPGETSTTDPSPADEPPESEAVAAAPEAPAEATEASTSAPEAPAEATEAEPDAPEGAAPEAAATGDAETPPADGGESPSASDAAAATPQGEGSAAAKADGGEASSAPRRPKYPALARAFRSRRPVKGRIADVVKSGWEVRIGKVRAFCPASQFSLEPVEDPQSVVGQELPFRIVQFRRGGEDIVVSHRTLLEADRAEEAKAVRATLIEGAVMQGKITNLAEFGAFVDLGAGVRGLVHISEIARRRVEKVSDAVSVGDVVEVKILKIQHERDRISLSIRRAKPDPWKGAADRYTPGSRHTGKVLRVEPFGAFLEFESGLDGLAPARECPPTGKSWSESFAVGAEVPCIVLSVEPKRRRLSVIPAVEGLELDERPVESGQERAGRVQHIERFGIFVWLGPGAVGMMPTQLSATKPGTRLDAKYTPGDSVQVRVIDVAEDGRRIRLASAELDADAIVAAEEARNAPRKPPMRAERRERRDAGRREAKPSGGGGRGRERTLSAGPEDTTFGSNLGDLLKAALGRDEGGE